MGENIFRITAFTAGLISFFSPCILPVLPVYMTTLLGGSDENKSSSNDVKVNMRPILRTLLFILGLSAVFISLGFGASYIGYLFRSRIVSIVIGIIIVFLGLHQMELINFKFLNSQKNIEFSSRRGYIGSFLLGLGFSLGWSPCVGPVLSSILAISISTSSVHGAILMAVYSLGLSIPFVVIAIFYNWMMKHFSYIKRKMRYAKKIGGILIIMMGILLITGGLNFITSMFMRISN